MCVRPVLGAERSLPQVSDRGRAGEGAPPGPRAMQKEAEQSQSGRRTGLFYFSGNEISLYQEKGIEVTMNCEQQGGCHRRGIICPAGCLPVTSPGLGGTVAADTKHAVPPPPGPCHLLLGGGCAESLAAQVHAQRTEPLLDLAGRGEWWR